MEDSTTTRLYDAETSAAYIVTSLPGSGRHLRGFDGYEIPLDEGGMVHVLSHTSKRGPSIIDIEGSRYAIPYQLSRSIWLKPLEAGTEERVKDVPPGFLETLILVAEARLRKTGELR